VNEAPVTRWSRVLQALGWVRALSLPTMAIIACVIVPLGVVRHVYVARHVYPRTVLWGGVVLASAVGFGGALVDRLFPGGRRLGWGLEAALGLAVHLALGGVLAAFSRVSVTTIVGEVAVGLAAFAWVSFRRQRERATPPRTHPTSSADVAVVVLFFGIALVHYLGMAANRPGNAWDDYQAYFTYPRQLLGSGSLIEPFSVRRLAAYGGQPYLQALILPFSTVFRLGVLDNGLCFLVLGGIAIGWVQERPRLPIATAAPALIGLVLLPHTVHNSASELSGAVFFAATFRLLGRKRAATESAARNALAVALATFAACTLRQSNLIPAAAIPAVWYVLRFVRDRGLRRRWAGEAALAGLFTGALLLPWMILSYRSSGTLLYPAFAGNGVKEFGLFEPITKVEQIRFVVGSLLYPGPLPGILFAFASGLLLPSRRSSDALRAMLAGASIGAVAVFITIAAGDELNSARRFILSFELGFYLSACLAVAGAMRGPRSARSGATIAVALLVTALGLELAGGRETLQTIYIGDIDAINTELDVGAKPDPADPADAPYVALQKTVPEHEKLLAMLDEPFRLDFHRNHIMTWDQPGSASPRPHIPVGGGSQALSDYLLGLGIRYVAFTVGGSSPEYQPSNWAKKLTSTCPPRDMKSRCAQLRAMARFYVDIFANLVELAAKRKQLYAKQSTYVLDLAAPTVTPPAP
jgi:hypothetical protein